MFAFDSPSYIFELIGSHGLLTAYIAIFIIMCLEGQIIVIIAAFAASLGYLNVWFVFILAVLGGVIPDSILYIIGRSIRNRTMEKFVSHFGLSKNRIAWLENKIKAHSIKSVAIVKIVPPLPVPGLILCGFTKMNFRKFFLAQVTINILGSAIFVLIGFYSGTLTSELFRYLNIGEFLLPAFIALILGFYFLSKYALKHLSNFFETV
jgi:membrane protein DedA with SNARE-associated domain